MRGSYNSHFLILFILKMLHRYSVMIFTIHLRSFSETEWNSNGFGIVLPESPSQSIFEIKVLNERMDLFKRFYFGLWSMLCWAISGMHYYILRFGSTFVCWMNNNFRIEINLECLNKFIEIELLKFWSLHSNYYIRISFKWSGCNWITHI